MHFRLNILQLVGWNGTKKKSSKIQEKRLCDKRDRGSLKRVSTNTVSTHSMRNESLHAVADRRCDICMLSGQEQERGR